MAPGLGTRGWDQQALLFRCFACARQRWQPAASRATFLRVSESNVRQWRLALGHAVGTSRPCCFAVSHAAKVAVGSSQSYTFLRASETNVRQWRLALGHAVGTSRPCCCAVSHALGNAVSLFRMRPPKVAAGSSQSYTFLRASETNVRQWRLALGHAVGTSRPCCCAVSHAPGKGGSRQLLELLFKGFPNASLGRARFTRLGHLPLAGFAFPTHTHIRPHTHPHTHTETHTLYATLLPRSPHKCLSARPSLFRSLYIYIYGPYSGLCSLCRRLMIPIRSSVTMSSASSRSFPGVGGRGR